MRLFLFVLLFISISKSEVLIPNQSKTGYNLLTNPGFESSKLGWTTSGTTLSVAKSSPSYWDNNFATFSSGSSGTIIRSEKVAIPVTYSDCMYSFTYAGTNAASMTVAIEDESSNILAGTSQSLTNFSGYKSVKGYFSCPKQSSLKKYGIRFLASGTFGAIEADNFYLGQADTSVVGVATGWIPYTPTFGGMGTVTNISFFYRQVTDSIEIQGSFTTGTTAAALATVSMPNNFVADPVKFPSIRNVGTWAAGATLSTLSNKTVIAETSSNLLSFGYNSTSTPELTRQNGNAIMGNSITYTLFARVPIQGLTSTDTAISARCQSDAACESVFTASVSSTGVISNNTLNWLSSCTNANPSVCTFAISFSVAPICIGANSSTTTTVTYPNTSGFNVICFRSGTDFKASQNIIGYLGTDRTERANISNGGSCSFSTAPSAGVSSTSFVTTGQCRTTFATGAFSAVPTCTCSVNGGVNVPCNPTTTLTYVDTVTYIGSTGTATNQPVNLICVGPR